MEDTVAAAALPAQLGRQLRLGGPAAHADAGDHRAVQRRPGRATRRAAGAIFVCRPARAQRRTRVRQGDSLDAGASRVSQAGDRRRPAAGAELLRISAAREGSFEHGIQMGLERILASPQFMFRVERDPAGAAPGSVYRISDLELASRLSFFLWSSVPDDELLTVAAAGEAEGPAMLEQQVRRMLADPQARRAGHQFRRAVAAAAQRPQRAAQLRRVSRLRRQPAAGVPARDRAVLRQHHARGPQRARPAARGLHVRERAPGAPLRHPQRVRQPLPPRAGDRRGAQGPARAGQHPGA